MTTVYVPKETMQENGKFYLEMEVPEGLPLGEGVVYVAPDESLLFPRWDPIKGFWVEDKDAIIATLKIELVKQEQQMTETQLALAEVFEIMIGGDA